MGGCQSVVSKLLRSLGCYGVLGCLKAIVAREVSVTVRIDMDFLDMQILECTECVATTDNKSQQPSIVRSKSSVVLKYPSNVYCVT